MFSNYRERFLIYPLLFIVLFAVLFNGFSEVGLVKTLNEIFIEGFYHEFVSFYGITLNKTVYLVIYGYIFGFCYGTISQFVKVRTFRGLFQMALFATKAGLIFLYLPYGVLLLIAELLLTPVAMFIKRKFKLKKKKKENDQLAELMRNVIREENEKQKTFQPTFP